MAARLAGGLGQEVFHALPKKRIRPDRSGPPLPRVGAGEFAGHPAYARMTEGNVNLLKEMSMKKQPHSGMTPKMPCPLRIFALSADLC